MNDRDQAEIDVEELLAKFPDSWSPSCREVCNAVAGVLRKRDARIAAQKRMIDQLQRATDRMDELETELAAIYGEVEIEAEALLPCASVYCDGDHFSDCPAFYRFAVTKALRKRDEEKTKLQAVFDSLAPTNSQAYEGLLATGQKLIDLEVQLATAKQEIERLKADANEVSFALTSSGLTTIIKERDQLRAELVAATQEIERLKAELDELKKERKGLADVALFVLKRGW